MNTALEVLTQFAALVLGTFVSEDATCITAGLLARQGELHVAVAVLGSFLGIYLGDLGLWLLGKLLGGRLARRFAPDRFERVAAWLDRRGAVALLASRFLPGTRLPLYVAAGMSGYGFGRFAGWTLLAAIAWTPLLVLGVALIGPALTLPLERWLGGGWQVVALAAAGIYAGLSLMRSLATEIGRARSIARVSRLWRWEFWPSWLFYLPLLPWLGWLAIRYRSLTVWTAANPGIPQGGVVGESKAAILAQLPDRWTLPSTLLPAGPLAARFQALEQAIDRSGWEFPLILKPDAAQRGAGVKRVGDLAAAREYLAANPGPVLAQRYHPGPFEAGIFYVRLPGEPRGRIFSLTDKVFPRITGDGRATLETLIWRHPRYRMQAARFLARHARQRDRVLAAGETMPLALAGNHCQGTLFRDGAHLITPELEQTIDAIAREFPGFYVGRFDVRYGDPAAFRAGEDLAIVELNGVTSESTNIYDPARSLVAAYRTLARQWEILFAIGNANRRRGIETTAAWDLLKLVRGYYRQVQVSPLSD